MAFTSVASFTTTFFVARISVPLAVSATRVYPSAGVASIVSSVPYATALRSSAPVALSVPSPSFVRLTAKVFLAKVAFTSVASFTITFFVARISVPLAVSATSVYPSAGVASIVSSVPYSTALRLSAPVALSVPSPSCVSVTPKVFFAKVAFTSMASFTTTLRVASISVPLAVSAIR